MSLTKHFLAFHLSSFICLSDTWRSSCLHVKATICSVYASKQEVNCRAWPPPPQLASSCSAPFYSYWWVFRHTLTDYKASLRKCCKLNAQEMFDVRCSQYAAFVLFFFLFVDKIVKKEKENHLENLTLTKLESSASAETSQGWLLKAPA